MIKFVSKSLLKTVQKNIEKIQALKLDFDESVLLDVKEEITIACLAEEILYETNLEFMTPDKVEGLQDALLTFDKAASSDGGQNIFLDVLSAKKEQIVILKEVVSAIENILIVNQQVKDKVELIDEISQKMGLLLL